MKALAQYVGITAYIAALVSAYYHTWVGFWWNIAIWVLCYLIILISEIKELVK